MTTLTRICLKRLNNDMKILKKNPLEYVEAYPDERDRLKWYFLIKGPEFSVYKDGYYIGMVLHDPEYPFKPPDYKMLTPSGRYMIEQKICVSNSTYHKNEWSSAWNINSILNGFLSIMLDDREHGISHIHASDQEKKAYAKHSVEYNKKHHMEILKGFSRFVDENGDPKEEEHKKPKKKRIKKRKKKISDNNDEKVILKLNKKTRRKRTKKKANK